MTHTDAVIVSAVRTPVGIGKPEKGALSGVHPIDLSALVLQEVTGRIGLDPALVDDVIWGAVSQVGSRAATRRATRFSPLATPRMSRV